MAMTQEMSIDIAITTDLRTKLQKLATAEKQTLSTYVEKVLRSHVEQQEQTEERRRGAPPGL
jgi:predicted transcriptional regulator